ncbi:hypothetical protein RB595_010634 [Gaeumannomyces hyphopodioides]
MRSSHMLAAALVALAESASAAAGVLQSAAAAAREMRYESGEVHMTLMRTKESFWAEEEALGIMNSSQYPSFARAAAPIPCVDGLAKVIPNDAKNTFKCNNVDFYDFKSHTDLGSRSGQGAASWGWTSPEGREFVAIAQADGAAFAEVTSEGKLVYLGRLPQYSSTSIWREMRSYKSFLVIGSEATNHGVQVFDFRKAQCLVYRGPDTKYFGRDICYGYNEDTLTIYDVTDKSTTNIISRTTYTGASYTHQGWVTNTTWQEYLVLDDEYDEYDRVGPGADRRAITYFWDIRSLEKPKQTGFFRSSVRGIDHNQFVVGQYAFQSNYANGLRVLDLASLPRDPTGAGVRETAYFDVYPEDDNVAGGGTVEFVGTWSNYPFFKSGFIVINTIERGAFVVKMTNRQ